jgi:glucose-1-phosphate adenylyltransferase
VGTGNDFDTPNVDEPERLNTGITVVGKRAVIPASARIGRNVRIAGEVRPADFKSKRVKSGSSIEVKTRRARKPKARPR